MNPAPARTAWLTDFVLLSAIWGASFVFMRLGALQFGPVPTSAVRVAIAAAFLLPILLFKGLGRQLLAHWKALLLVGLLNSGIPFACYAFALLWISTGLSSILNATVPLFGALVAWVWLRERLDASRVLGLLVGFVGVALLASDKAGFQPGAAQAPWGPVLAVGACLLATLCYGISASFTRRYLEGVPPLVTSTGSLLGASLALALPAWWLWPAKMPDASAWGALLVVGIFCTGVAYLLFFRLIAVAGASRALAVTFVVPVFAIFYGTVLLGEVLTLRMLLCGAVVLLGTVLATGVLTLRRPPR
ncbi:MAG: DMT family transporter [Pseudomonadota bacterium]